MDFSWYQKKHPNNGSMVNFAKMITVFFFFYLWKFQMLGLKFKYRNLNWTLFFGRYFCQRFSPNVCLWFVGCQCKFLLFSDCESAGKNQLVSTQKSHQIVRGLSSSSEFERSKFVTKSYIHFLWYANGLKTSALVTVIEACWFVSSHNDS